MSTRHARILSFAILVCIMAAADGVVAAKNISACGVIAEPGSYLLSKNLTAIGDCLTVTADFVTIDLGGFTIFGDGTGAGIKGDGTRRAITMRDGTITNFNDGIDFCPVTGPETTGHQLVVERIRAIDNADAGICLLYHNVVAGVTVKDSYAANNGGAGIQTGGRAVITGNNVSQNTDGLKISGASTIVGNIIAGNSNAGILSGNHSFDIVNNRVQGLTIGIQVFCPSLIMGNVIGGATPLITQPSAGTCTIEHNTVNPF